MEFRGKSCKLFPFAGSGALLPLSRSSNNVSLQTWSLAGSGALLQLPRSSNNVNLQTSSL